ncbi:hypothetical protein MNBD_GAMMA19-1154 [hydrothermal vent metagenome]|uniref:Uncharacterized protein n=1 Tax=hydrothermal vent metagenome TaxID=652676 RepID=A0A3B1AIG0_9ZZZZ
MFLAGIQGPKPLNTRTGALESYVTEVPTSWRVINAEVAETQRTQRKTRKMLRPCNLNGNGNVASAVK